MRLKAKKTLGQNFLKNKKVLEKMIKAGEIEKDELVLEIGPGKGVLTAELLLVAKRVIAIEKDSRLIPFLEEKFKQEIHSGKLQLFEADALELDYEKLNLVNQDFIVVANLPYYITGKFLSSTLSNDIQPKKIVLLLQKEIVERITGEERQNGKMKNNNKENILSVSVKVYGEPYYVTTVSRKNFNPEPNVDSAVLAIYNVSKGFFQKNKISEKEFFEFVKLAFGNKRKTLMKNLSQKFEKQKVEQILIKQKIDIRVRAEDLSVSQLKEIFIDLK